MRNKIKYYFILLLALLETLPTFPVKRTNNNKKKIKKITIRRSSSINSWFRASGRLMLSYTSVVSRQNVFMHIDQVCNWQPRCAMVKAFSLFERCDQSGSGLSTSQSNTDEVDLTQVDELFSGKTEFVVFILIAGPNIGNKFKICMSSSIISRFLVSELNHSKWQKQIFSSHL